MALVQVESLVVDAFVRTWVDVTPLLAPLLDGKQH